MNTTLRRPPLVAPGWGWLPQVLRRGAPWRTVGFFMLWGPLVGGAPYVWTIVAVPFAYWFGVLPAAMAGLLYACWRHAPGRRHPAALWRAAVGFCCGLAVAAAMVLPAALAAAPVEWWYAAVVALHGVPAAVILALTGRLPRPRAVASSPAGVTSP